MWQPLGLIAGFFWCLCKLPLQLFASSWRMYPRGQEQRYPPSVFLQIKLQGFGACMHSSTSRGRGRMIQNKETDPVARNSINRSWERQTRAAFFIGVVWEVHPHSLGSLLDSRNENERFQFCVNTGGEFKPYPHTACQWCQQCSQVCRCNCRSPDCWYTDHSCTSSPSHGTHRYLDRNEKRQLTSS